MGRCDKPYVVTISHQIGSGGGIVGRLLAQRLGIPLIDRQVLKQVSQKLHMAEAELEGREERVTSFWQSFQRLVQMVDHEQGRIVDRYVPSDRELFETECETIRRIAENSQAIFLGRAGQYILREHPCHFRLLLTADRPERIQRLCSLRGITAGEAGRLIETNDRERAQYIKTFTSQNWLDARLYDLCLNTSSLGHESAETLVFTAIQAKLGL